MTAATSTRLIGEESWSRHELTLASGFRAYAGAQAAINLATGKVQPAAASPNLLVIGLFANNVDASLADKLVDVDFRRQFWVCRLVNSATSPLTAADVGKLCFVEDDQTVSLTSSTAAPTAGRVWAVLSATAVLVEILPPSRPHALVATVAAFAAGNVNISPVSGAVHDIPTTAAASTVTLSAAAAEGTVAHFVADGTKNGHTVTYRDATGLTALTTALTASKRHQVTAIFLNGKWTATAYIAP